MVLNEFDELYWHSLAASVVGCEPLDLKSMSLADDFAEITAPRSRLLEFNSALNLVHSNWTQPLPQPIDEYKVNNTYSPPLEEERCADLILSPQSVYVPQGSMFFVIKSFTEEDVKTGFMHKVWSSTDLGNKRLNKAYSARHSNERVFLFFSVNGSGKFCGVAEMVSGLTDTCENPIWIEKSRWKGQFKVQWLYVKDIYNHHLRHLKVPQNELKPVTNSRDTQELPEDVGMAMLDIFKKLHSHSSFLQNLGPTL